MFAWFSDLSPRERRTMGACFGGWSLDALDVQVFSFVIPSLLALWKITAGQAGELATITLLIETSEERGSPGTTKLIETLAAQSDVEFNMEPGDPPDALTVWRKGAGSILMQVRGRAAHAGMVPQNGRNAAVELPAKHLFGPVAFALFETLPDADNRR